MVKNLIITLVIFLFPHKAISNDISDYIQYGAGYYSSIYIHELGHAAMAKYLGATDIKIEVPKKGTVLSGITYYKRGAENSEFTRRMESISGLLAGNMASEIAIQNKELHSSPFLQSIVATAQVVNIANVYNYYTKIRGINGWNGNDIDNYELNGGNPHILSAILVSYSIWSLNRMSKNSIPLYGLELNF